MILRIVVVLALSVSGFAQDVAARLDEVAAGAQKYSSFTGSVLVAQGGKVIFEQSYGMASIELGVPNGPDTKFRLGSITKQFTSAAILQLEEQGKLKVTDAACQYIAECPENWKAITIHQLLSHTSGIPSYTDDPSFMKPKFMRVPMTPLEILMFSKGKPMDFPPGSQWKYDNTGYIFLGAIIEKVSGEKYADYLQRDIFGPLEMRDSGYDVTTAILKNRAAGYSGGSDGMHNADYLDMSLPYAAGSLYSTVRDLYRWDRALYTDKVLSKASRDKMWTPVMKEYGYGWGIQRVSGRKQVGHGGGINGFATYIARYPDDDAVVIVLANNDHADAGALAKGLLGGAFSVAVDS